MPSGKLRVLEPVPRAKGDHAPIRRVKTSAYKVPTDYPEADGTYSWDSTTMVLAEVEAGGQTGLGYTYADTATAELIRSKLAAQIEGRDAFDIPGCWSAMVGSIRNLGRPGIASMAIAAVDSALWDLKARLLGVPLVKLFGQVHESVAAYGSGGFTSYPDKKLQQQFEHWRAQGITMFKMKVGSQPQRDPERVKAARRAIGSDAMLFVDANGAYSRKQALRKAWRFGEYGVSWFEEPVTSDDLEGLHLLRDRVPAGMEIAAGEYGYDLAYFRRMLEAQAVDVLQADATRCTGFSEFLRVGALCEAFQLPLSAHTAPSLHVHACCALQRTVHIEYFHDHVRLEHFLFDGAATVRDGRLFPDLSRPGLGLELKRADARKYAV